MKLIIAFLPFIICLNNLIGQKEVTDSEIAKSLLDQPYYQVNTILDSLKVFYVAHMPSNLESDKRVYSIANSQDVVKVYKLFISDKGIIEKVIVNFRHNDKNQLIDLRNLVGAFDFHVGTFSTDVTFD